MTHRQTQNHEDDAEAVTLCAILEEYADVVGRDTRITRVGNVGHAVQFAKCPASPNGDWVLYDIDDTVIGYTAAKSVRLKHYDRYLQRNDIPLASNSANTLLEAADTLSRRETGGRKMYHIDTHVALVAWATEMVCRLNATDAERWIGDFEQRAATFVTSKPGQTPDDTPFYYDAEQLTFKEPVPGSERVSDIYETVFDAMIRPERYQELLDTMAAIRADTADQPSRLNQGILTYGTPAFQLRKTLELFKDMQEQGTELCISSVLLATVHKGVFFIELLEESPLNSSDAPHAVLLVDDDPSELRSFVGSAGASGDSRHNLDLLGVRYHRSGTKNFEAAAKYGEHAGKIGYHSAEDTPTDLRLAIYDTLRSAADGR